MVLKKTLESLLDCKEIKPVNPKEISPEYSLEGLMLKLKPQTISSSVIPVSFCLQSFPASGAFLMSQFFVSGGQNIGASASALVFPMNIQGWFLLGLTGLISKGLSRVFSSTTVQKHQFFGAQLSLWSNSTLIHDYWQNHAFDYMDLCWQSKVSAF